MTSHEPFLHLRTKMGTNSFKFQNCIEPIFFGAEKNSLQKIPNEQTPNVRRRYKKSYKVKKT